MAGLHCLAVAHSRGYRSAARTPSRWPPASAVTLSSIPACSPLRSGRFPAAWDDTPPPPGRARGGSGLEPRCRHCPAGRYGEPTPDLHRGSDRDAHPIDLILSAQGTDDDSEVGYPRTTAGFNPMQTRRAFRQAGWLHGDRSRFRNGKFVTIGVHSPGGFHVAPGSAPPNPSSSAWPEAVAADR